MALEDKIQTEFSPGAIESNEDLLRIVYVREHVGLDNRLLPEAIPTQDLSDKNRGCSVFRKLYVKREKLNRVIESYVSKAPERECQGIAPVNTRSVRGIKDKEIDQVFFVIDDAQTKDDEAHAVIIFGKKYGKAERRGLRKKLVDKFTAILVVDEIFSELTQEINAEKITGSWVGSIKKLFCKFLAFLFR